MDYREKIDFSSIDTYLSCKRAFLFQYILHLRPTRPNIDLTFGSCWHYGLEVVYQTMMTAPSEDFTSMMATKASVAAFNALWSLTASSFNNELCYPKNPGHAADMYHSYWKQYLTIDKAKEIIGVENPINIYLGSGLPRYVGRLDLTTLDGRTLEIMDHKTSKYDSAIILAGFQSSLQTDGYITAGNIYFDSLPRIVYNLALCQKSKIGFRRWTIMRSKATINRFIDDLKAHIRSLLINLNTYETEQGETALSYIPQSFRRAAGYACTKYFRKCQYFDLCQMRNNPFPWGVKPPEGFIHYEWDPTVHEEEIKKALEGVS